MEDYTCLFIGDHNKVLGTHMPEVCPTVSDGKPSLEIYPLGIGSKADPARLVFNTKTGTSINITILDMGNHF